MLYVTYVASWRNLHVYVHELELMSAITLFYRIDDYVDFEEELTDAKPPHCFGEFSMHTLAHLKPMQYAYKLEYSAEQGLRDVSYIENNWHSCSPLQKTQCFNITETVHIRQCNYVAAANQRQFRHSNAKNRTYRLRNRWLSHGWFAQFSSEPWDSGKKKVVMCTVCSVQSQLGSNAIVILIVVIGAGTFLFAYSVRWGVLRFLRFGLVGGALPASKPVPILRVILAEKAPNYVFLGIFLKI